MIVRTVSVLFLLIALALPSTALAGLRSPQIPVGGTGLQSYFDSVGESIDVQHDQLDGELVRSSVSAQSTFAVLMELGRHETGLALGLYDGAAALPTPFPVFPAGAEPSWFSAVRFRLIPTRIEVLLFDPNAAQISAVNYLGGNKNAVGFSLQGPSGTFYSQDSRNPGSRPQVLFYAGTGLNLGAVWLCFEDASLDADSDRDFDDTVVMFIHQNGSVVPVHRTSWAQLKSRFR